MTKNRLSRRQLLSGAGAALSVGLTTRTTATEAMNSDSSRPTVPFSYCFNTSTIRGQNLSLDKEVEITAKAGYQAIEPWVDRIN
ncbi:MAG: sugar phosphate isomerase/epimerase, partial [Candidatus Hydrogenedentota bacterium]